MGWRSVVISQPARLSLARNALQIEQEPGKAQVPLEDISVLVLDQPQVTLTGQLLAALAQAQIAVLTVGSDHHPNGVLLPLLPHSRALKIMRAQLATSVPQQKRWWQRIVRQKIINQAELLARFKHKHASHLHSLATRVRSGDPENFEAQAARAYFPALFGIDFQRGQSRFYNAAINYGYAIVRAALARTLCAYGFLPAFGLHHCNELNAFNLADDLIEPWRPVLDGWILQQFPQETSGELSPKQKGQIVGVLHQDVHLSGHSGGDGKCTALAGIDASIQSLARALHAPGQVELVLPVLQAQALCEQDDLF